MARDLIRQISPQLYILFTHIPTPYFGAVFCRNTSGTARVRARAGYYNITRRIRLM